MTTTQWKALLLRGILGSFCAGLLRLAVEGRELQIYGDGSQLRDFVFVDDVAEANLAAMGQDAHGVYNVGTGIETSVNELYRMLAGLTASSAKEVHVPAKAGEQIRSVVDPSRIKQELGWEVKVDLAEGLQQTVEYFQGKNR